MWCLGLYINKYILKSIWVNEQNILIMFFGFRENFRDNLMLEKNFQKSSLNCIPTVTYLVKESVSTLLDPKSVGFR